MKAVGNNPLARYVGQETGARPSHANDATPHTNQPAGEPGEPTPPAQINKTKPLDFVPIGWSLRRQTLSRNAANLARVAQALYSFAALRSNTHWRYLHRRQCPHGRYPAAMAASSSAKNTRCWT